MSPFSLPHPRLKAPWTEICRNVMDSMMYFANAFWRLWKFSKGLISGNLQSIHMNSDSETVRWLLLRVFCQNPRLRSHGLRQKSVRSSWIPLWSTYGASCRRIWECNIEWLQCWTVRILKNHVYRLTDIYNIMGLSSSTFTLHGLLAGASQQWNSKASKISQVWIKFPFGVGQCSVSKCASGTGRAPWEMGGTIGFFKVFISCLLLRLFAWVNHVVLWQGDPSWHWEKHSIKQPAKSKTDATTTHHDTHLSSCNIFWQTSWKWVELTNQPPPAGKHSEVEGGARGSWNLSTPHGWGQVGPFVQTYWSLWSLFTNHTRHLCELMKHAFPCTLMTLLPRCSRWPLPP